MTIRTSLRADQCLPVSSIFDLPFRYGAERVCRYTDIHFCIPHVAAASPYLGLPSQRVPTFGPYHRSYVNYLGFARLVYAVGRLFTMHPPRTHARPCLLRDALPRLVYTRDTRASARVATRCLLVDS